MTPPLMTATLTPGTFRLYTAFNREAYRSGDILPNAGHLLVTVAPDQVRVDYMRSYLPKDETPERRHGEVAFSYTVKSRAPGGR